MGGQGPRYPGIFQSLIPSRAPAGRLAEAAPSSSPEMVGAMPKRTQCTQVILGALGSGASRSSTIRARLLVPFRTPVQERGGDLSAPSHVYSVAISFSCSKLEEGNRSAMAAPCFVGAVS